VALAVVLALGAGGCGSSAPSAATYRREANRVCAQFLVKVNRLHRPSGASLQEVEAYLATAGTLLHEENTQLAALAQPTGSGRRYSNIYALQADIDRTVTEAVHAGSLQGLAAVLASLQRKGDLLDHQFDAAGLTTCGGSGRG
jgi:hypothetical protein